MASNRKKLDNRIRVLIENSMAQRHRSFFVIVGDKGRDQVVILHHILSKAAVKARPNVLWCYKTELGFSSNRQKRMKQMKKKIRSGTLDINKDDPFELFVASTNIRYCYYSDTHRILGNTYGMCILQDFEALTPNLLARTIETVDGGGVVVLLLRSVSSLKQLYTMTMDVHSRYRTESHQDVVGRFNERFILSLASCRSCMVIDDQLNILPISSHTLTIAALPPKNREEPESPEQIKLQELKDSFSDPPEVGNLVKCTRTLDQAEGLLKCIEAVSEKMLRTTVAMTAARGRGKSATLGLAMAAAVGFGYSNIFVTSPSPENLKTLFEFVFKGLDALEYHEHQDYEIIQSTNPEFNKSVVRVNIYHEHRQTIQYIHPSDSHKLGQAELVVIDEAAAIPLPLVRQLLGPHVVFMASTINGYEGTGRSLSLKLIDDLRKKSSVKGADSSDSTSSNPSGRVLREVTLNEPIRYSAGDDVEKWLNDLLCLNAANVKRITHGCPLPKDCELYHVDRDTLFCYHKASEDFLHQVMSLYVASHYKNTPDDLQLLSDAPAHHIFALLPPVSKEQTSLPDVLCVLQVSLEGSISKSSVTNSLSRGKRLSGDLIPWTVSQQFVDHDFAGLSGARVVRIATHPDLQRMGYGTQALAMLQRYYEGQIPNLFESEMETQTGSMTTQASSLLEASSSDLHTESIKPRSKLPALLCKLSERPPETLDYLGVSFGITVDLYKFWNRAGYKPVYIRQTQNDLTGEHSCIMLRAMETPAAASGKWLQHYHSDFCCRFVSLLSYEFRSFAPGLGISILQPKKRMPEVIDAAYSSEDARRDFSPYDLKRIDLYSRNMADHHIIRDLLPKMSQIYYLRNLSFSLPAAQSAILLALGLQRKTIKDVELDLGLQASQIMGLYNRIIRKFNQMFEELQAKDIEARIAVPKAKEMNPVEESLEEELSKAASEITMKQKKQAAILQAEDLSRYAISGQDEEWQKVLSSGQTHSSISISKKMKRPSSEGHVGGKPKAKKESSHGKRGKEEKRKSKH